MKSRVFTQGVDEFKERLERLTKEGRKVVLTKVTNAVANTFMAKVKDNTPVGDYSDLKEPYNTRNGGKLRDAWRVGEVAEKDGVYHQMVKNPLEYASYVNYGHVQTSGRYVPALGKQLKKSFVKGKHFVEKAEEETRQVSPIIIKSIVDRELNKVFK